MEKFHLIGVKGTGMSALAGILKDLGHEVSGSDVEEDFFTSKKLKEKAIAVSLLIRIISVMIKYILPVLVIAKIMKKFLRF